MKTSCLILAAGRSRRFLTRTSKVLHPLLGKPIVQWVIDAAASVHVDQLVVVVGSADQATRAWLQERHAHVQTAIQQDARGTADAVRSGLTVLPKEDRWVFVLSGDVPFVRMETLAKLRDICESTRCLVALATFHTANPSGYGRVKRNTSKQVERIVEEKDATIDEKEISEANAGVYCFYGPFLREELPKLKPVNAQGEYYLTDLVETAARRAFGERQGVETVSIAEEEVMGINDRQQHARASEAKRTEIIQRWLEFGVTFELPQTVIVEPTVVLAKDCVIGPHVKLTGNTVLEEGVVVEGGSLLKDVTVGAESMVHWGTVAEGARIGKGCAVGPMARLRPGTVLHDNVKIGNFVELKKAELGDGSKASHLSYLGDVTVGQNVNIGCGFVACNYDGLNKHHSTIEDGVFIGSDSQILSPVRVGKGAYIATSTTVTHDVPPGALVISRVKQMIKPGYVDKLMKKLKGKGHT